jgi:O-antigen/teichoic acid export membrane protein
VRVGQYYRAFTLGVENEQRISGIVARVMFPVYSRTEDLHHMRDVRARITRVNACVIFPLLALFIAVAPVFVPWLFGSRWDEAVLPAQILAAGGMAQTLGQSTGPMVLAAGKARVLSVFNLCQFALYGVTVYFAAGRGLTAVCIAVSVYYALTVVVGYRFLLHRYVAMPAGQLLRDAGPALVGSAVTLLAALGLVRLGTDAGLPALAILAPVGVIGATLYVLVLRALFPASYADIRLLAAHVLPERMRSWRPRLPGRAPAPAGASR